MLRLLKHHKGWTKAEGGHTPFLIFKFTIRPHRKNLRWGGGRLELTLGRMLIAMSAYPLQAAQKSDDRLSTKPAPHRVGSDDKHDGNAAGEFQHRLCRGAAPGHKI